MSPRSIILARLVWDEFRKEIRCIKKFSVKHSLVFNRIVLERCLRCAKVYSFIAAFTGVPDREDCCLQLYHSQIKFWDIKCRVCSVTDVACLPNMNYFRSKQKEPNIKKFQVTCCVPQFFFRSPLKTHVTSYVKETSNYNIIACGPRPSLLLLSPITGGG